MEHGIAQISLCPSSPATPSRPHTVTYPSSDDKCPGPARVPAHPLSRTADEPQNGGPADPYRPVQNEVIGAAYNSRCLVGAAEGTDEDGQREMEGPPLAENAGYMQHTVVGVTVVLAVESQLVHQSGVQLCPQFHKHAVRCLRAQPRIGRGQAKGSSPGHPALLIELSRDRIINMSIVSNALVAIRRVMDMDALDTTQTRDLRQAGDMMLQHIALLSSTAQQPSLKAPRVLGASPPGSA